MAKTKIEFFEDEIIATELTDEKLETFKKLLVRAGNDYCRNQHCYITALGIPAERYEEAVRLIEFGINTYTYDDLGMGRAWECLGLVYERAGHYEDAYDALIKSTEYENHNDVWNLLRTRIHVDDFKYSEEIERYYSKCMKCSEFSKAFLNNRLYLLISQIIIAKEKDNYDEIKCSYDEICKMIEPEYKGELYDLLKKHRYTEKVALTDKCVEFLDDTANYLNR